MIQCRRAGCPVRSSSGTIGLGPAESAPGESSRLQSRVPYLRTRQAGVLLDHQSHHIPLVRAERSYPVAPVGVLDHEKEIEARRAAQVPSGNLEVLGTLLRYRSEPARVVTAA